MLSRVMTGLSESRSSLGSWLYHLKGSTCIQHRVSPAEGAHPRKYSRSCSMCLCLSTLGKISVMGEMAAVQDPS